MRQQIDDAVKATRAASGVWEATTLIFGIPESETARSTHPNKAEAWIECKRINDEYIRQQDPEYYSRIRPEPPG